MQGLILACISGESSIDHCRFEMQQRLRARSSPGQRGVVGWFGRKCEHRLDWFHVSRRLERISKQLLCLPSSPVYGCRLAFHARNLNRIEDELWNSGIEIADWGMRCARQG
jgi:hypothetical protein